MDSGNSSGDIGDPAVRAAYCAELVRYGDPDRFLTLMTAPPETRNSLMALFAFNVEVARIPDSVGEPLLGQIRLTWWRDAIEECFAGSPRRHAVVLAMADIIKAHRLARSDFDAILEARQLDALRESPRDRADFRDYLAGTAGRINRLGAAICGADDSRTLDAVERVGVAWGLVGTVRALPFRRRLQRSALPADMLGKVGLRDPEGAGFSRSEALSTLCRSLLGEADNALMNARRKRRDISRVALPILLQARLADSHLRQLRRAGCDPFDPRLANPPAFRALSVAFGAFSGRW